MSPTETGGLLIVDISHSMGWTRLTSTARVERGPSEAARSASKEGSPHCQPLTSYPLSNKHRTTASP